MRAITRPIEEQRRNCEHCVDKYWTGVWLARCLGHKARRAHASMRRLLATMRVTSKTCEQRHLLAQEARGPKRRGRAPACSTIAKISYMKGVQQEAQTMSERVTAETPGSKEVVLRWARTMTSFRLGKSRAKAKAAPGGATPKKRRSAMLATSAGSQGKARSGLETFIRLKKSEEEGDVGPLCKRRRLLAKWVALPQDDRDFYNALAKQETESDRQRPPVNFPTFLQSDHAHLAQDRRGSAQRQAALRSFQEMLGHPSWGAGARLAALGTGLAKEAVDVKSSDKEIKAAAAAAFKYDPVALPASKIPMKPFATCRMRHGGLCRTDPCCAKAQIGTKNLYQHMVDNDISRVGPTLARFSIQGSPRTAEHHFITRVRGVGELALVVEAEAAQDHFAAAAAAAVDDVHGQVWALAESDDGVCKPSTTHLVFRRIIQNAARDLGVPVEDIAAIRATIVQQHKCHAAPFFCVAPVSEVHFDLSLCAVARRRRVQEEAAGGVELAFGVFDGPHDKPVAAPASDDDSDEAASKDDELHAHEMSDVDDESDVDPEEPVPVVTARGLKEYGVSPPVAPKLRAICQCCRLPIDVGSFRLRYRFRAGSTMAHLRWVHDECSVLLPPETRRSDLAVIGRWVRTETEEFQLERLEVLRRAMGGVPVD